MCCAFDESTFEQDEEDEDCAQLVEVFRKHLRANVSGLTAKIGQEVQEIMKDALKSHLNSVMQNLC